MDRDLKQLFSLCGEKDRAILLDLSTARFHDLLRLEYLSASLELWPAEFWVSTILCTRFSERLKAYLNISVMDDELTTHWMRDFYRAAPTINAKKVLSAIFTEY